VVWLRAEETAISTALCIFWLRKNFAFYVCHLLVTHYSPNVAKRSIGHQCNVFILRTDLPTIDLPSWKSLPGRISNGYISITVQDRRVVTMGGDHP